MTKRSIYYFFNKNEAITTANLFFADPDIEILKKLWGFIDHDLVKLGQNFVYESIC